MPAFPLEKAYRRVGGQPPSPSPGERFGALPQPFARSEHLVQHGSGKIAYPGRQHSAFPGGRRGGAAFQPFQRETKALRAVRPLRSDALPMQQKGGEFRGAYRLDLLPQRFQRAPVYAGEQAAFTPLVRAVRFGAGPKPAANHETFSLQRHQCFGAGCRLQPQRLRQFRGGHRPQNFKPAAQQFTDLGCGVLRLRADRGQLLPAFHTGPDLPAIADRKAERPALRRQLRKSIRVLRQFGFGQETRQVQGVVQFVRIARPRPGFRAHFGDRAGVGPRQRCGVFDVHQMTGSNRLGAAFLGRRIVEERIGLGGDDFLGQDRRRGRLGKVHVGRAPLKGAQQVQQAVGVHQVVQAIVQGLVDQRMIGDGAVAHEVLGARDQVGEQRNHEVLRIASLKLRRAPFALPVAEYGQRRGGGPSPARGKHG